MAFLDETGLGRLWAQIILKLNSKVPDGGTTGQILKKTETGTEWADESGAADVVQSNLDTHVNNTTVHVTAEEKSAWNAKLDSYTETDPTVPAWAKAASKPTYTASEVGADVSGSAASVQTNLDAHVNNTNIHVTAEEKSAWNAKLDSYTETDPTVPNWAKQSTKPTYTADEVGAAPVSHVEDTTVHVTADERATWNESILIGESLIELPNPHSRSLDVTYGDNKFVAVMYSSNKAIYSLDGFIWHETTLPGDLQWHAVTYGNGKFVAIASNSTIAAYSADGITWNQTSLPSGGYWWDVTYGNGKFVTIKANSNIAAYSNDGITWTEITLPVSKFWYTITYGNNRFVVLPDGSDVAIYSDDGMTWTETTLPVSKSWSGVSYGDNKFVAVSTNSNIAIYSSDGVTWTETTLPVSNYWEPIIYGGDKFVATAFNNDGNIAIYSYNGIEWSETAMPAVQNWKSLAYGQNKFVALSDTTMAAHSLDGITWSNTKPSLQTVSGTDVTDDTKVILGVSDKQDKLTGVAGQIVGFDENGNAISKDMPKSAASYTATLTTSGWAQSGDRYSQTVNVTGVTASTPVVLVDVALSGADLDADAAALEAWGIVSANNVAQGNGTLTFYALSVPSVNVPVNVGVIG